MPTILACPQFEADIVEQPHAAPVDEGEVLGPQQYLAGVRAGALSSCSRTFAADHQFSQPSGLVSRVGRSATISPCRIT